MAGSLIYDSTFAQFHSSRPTPPPTNSPRRRDQMLYQDAQNIYLAPPFDRRPTPPANLYEGLSPHPNDVAVGFHHHRSRSERSRKAMSVPVRHPSSIPPSAPLNNFRSSQHGDIGSVSLQHSFPWGHDEVIAEFSPRDQLALQQALASFPNQNYPFVRPVSTQNPLPPRLKVNPKQSRSRNWRSNDAESLPPRFRSPQPAPGPRVPSPPHNPPWNRPPHAHLSRVDVSDNASAFSHLPPQLSQPQHLSSFLQSNVSYRPQQIIDTRRVQEPKRIDISPKAKTLAPIGAERAQLLATNPRFCAVNNCTPHNYRHTLPVNLYSYDPLLQGLRPNHLARASQFDVPRLPAGPSELEKLYNRLKRTPNISRILSPLNPIRNPDSLVPSDVKWIKEEREIRRRRIMTSLDTSAFARRTGDRRSRTECEEFMPGLDISDHCYRCRQDTLCKRLLVQRAREMLRSTSTSPISSEGTLSSDEEDEILNTHVDAIATLGKGLELKTRIAVVDIDAIAGDEGAITLPTTSIIDIYQITTLVDTNPLVPLLHRPHSRHLYPSHNVIHGYRAT
ncbi:hypothetical protein BDM02DRAFT_3269108 [Thelephora ganbajun]|uniref:Uncharacterized protein n=1 Tax=Thelephora ganbajun TaxID=370292 RepID=A0ACB6ZGN8_THEGA|nr:hypothetical protein BDM02DRAFT_3269108 [Thelephora ganbajun]